MKRYRILVTEPAAEDLQKIAAYIADDLLEPITARRFVDKMREAVMSLTNMPARHALVADARLATQGIRKLPVDNYIVFYMVSEKEGTVTIIRVLYGRRDWEHLL